MKINPYEFAIALAVVMFIGMGAFAYSQPTPPSKPIPVHKWYLAMSCGDVRCEVMNCDTTTSPAVEYKAAQRQDPDGAEIKDSGDGKVLVTGGTIVQSFFTTLPACRGQIEEFKDHLLAESRWLDKYK